MLRKVYNYVKYYVIKCPLASALYGITVQLIMVILYFMWHFFCSHIPSGGSHRL